LAHPPRNQANHVTEYTFIDGDEYIDLPRETAPWIVEPLLSPGALLNIYGSPKAGKSRLALGLAIAISTGQDKWLDKYPIHQAGPVLWIEIDNSPAEWVQVLKDVRNEGYDLSNISFTDRDHCPYPFDLLDPEMDHDKVLGGMIEEFRQRRGCDPVLIVVDTIREAHSGDEDKSTTLRNVITKLQGVCGNAAILLISHSRKGGGLQATAGGNDNDEESGADRVMDGNRGSNYLVGKMQTVVRVTTTRGRTHGYLTAEGRSIGQERFRMKQKAPSYLWHPDHDPAIELAYEMKQANPDWSERRLSKELAQIMKVTEEKARHIVRRSMK
jgi:RecA-family ATPase